MLEAHCEVEPGVEIDGDLCLGPGVDNVYPVVRISTNHIAVRVGDCFVDLRVMRTLGFTIWRKKPVAAPVLFGDGWALVAGYNSIFRFYGTPRATVREGEIRGNAGSRWVCIDERVFPEPLTTSIWISNREPVAFK